MLPFNNNKEKSYRCFVCGVDSKTYDELKEHIISNHEEGREYLVCKYCGAAVRDIPLHYKIKHIGIPVPKDGQNRATIWYDFSGTKRKRDKKKVAFKEGYHISPKCNFKPQHYRSGYELEYYTLLDEDQTVAYYEVEPDDCVVEYFFQGKTKHYHPDLKVKYKDGMVNVVEIKPSVQTDMSQNRAKWDACNELCVRRGWTFSVKTEQGIQKLRKKVRDQKK